MHNLKAPFFLNNTQNRPEAAQRAKSNGGIAIGPILFVVAILAVLASAIAAGSGSFNSSTSQDSAKAMAQAIIQYGNRVKEATQRMLLVNNCNCATMKWDSPLITGDEMASLSARCNIYDLEGGGVTAMKLPDGALDASQSAQFQYGNYLFGFSRNGVWPNGNVTKILFYAPWLRQDVCAEINRLVRKSPSIETMSHSALMSLQSAGDCAPGVAFAFNNTAGAWLEGCVEGANTTNFGPGYYQPSGSYHYYINVVYR